MRTLNFDCISMCEHRFFPAVHNIIALAMWTTDYQHSIHNCSIRGIIG